MPFRGPDCRACQRNDERGHAESTSTGTPGRAASPIDKTRARASAPGSHRSGGLETACARRRNAKAPAVRTTGAFMSETRWRQPMCRPPFTANSAPVVKPDSSPASQPTMEAISCGVPRRLTGIVATIFSSTSGLIAMTMSVPM